MAIDATSVLLQASPDEVPLGPDPDRYDLGGVPVFHLPLPGSSTILALTFGTGRADEPTHLTGLTHLAEHIVMTGVGELAFDGNGRTEPFRVQFGLGGTPDEASTFLRCVGDSICNPLLDRVGPETSVLMTEQDMHGGSAMAQRMAWLRYGNAGLGQLAGFQLFLHDPRPEVLAHWMEQHFVSGNAAIWVAGVLPADLDLTLPTGGRHERRPTPAIRGLVTPAFAVEDMPGVVAGFQVTRSAATAVALRVAERRLLRALRVERSLGYDVSLDYRPVDETNSHAVLLASCQPERVAEVEGLLISVLDEIAARGVTEPELRLDRARFRRLSAEPLTFLARLDRHVSDLLMGAPHETLAELDAEQSAVTPEATRNAMVAAMSTMILAVPRSGFEPNRPFNVYPGASMIDLGNDVHRFAAINGKPRKPWEPKPPTPTLAVSEVAIAVEDDRGRRVSCVPWDECVAVVHEFDAVHVLGRDGFQVRVGLGDWKDASRVHALINAYAPSEVAVQAIHWRS